METIRNRMQHYLQKRKEKSLFRSLTFSNDLADFSSNDYLGLSRSAYISQQVSNDMEFYRYSKSGATGSRLLNGNSVLCEEVEKLLAETHHAEAALLFNSGFDANVGLISTVARPGDLIFYDEYVHASIQQGMKLSGARQISFRHNDLDDLERKLNENPSEQVCFIITESVFSMEGDRPDLQRLATLAGKYAAELIIDEAHATGIFGIHGSGLCHEAGIESQCFARIYTLGKAVASHGGIVAGSRQLKDYLVNFSKNFIYTTALETHNLLRVKHAYLYLQSNINQVINLKNRMNYFKHKATTTINNFEICGDGPVFGVIIPDNKKCREIALYLQEHHFDVRPILYPTVPESRERIRIILHSFNTFKEMDQLIELIASKN